MATITTRIRPFDLGEAHRRVRSPLERLRGYIRLYVALEGVALFCTFLAVWFWFTLVMDYGFFKLFGYDWVQEFDRWVRAMVLGAFFAGVVAAVHYPTFRREVLAWGALTGGVGMGVRSLVHLVFVQRSIRAVVGA